MFWYNWYDYSLPELMGLQVFAQVTTQSQQRDIGFVLFDIVVKLEIEGGLKMPLILIQACNSMLCSIPALVRTLQRLLFSLKPSTEVNSQTEINYIPVVVVVVK